MHCSIVICTRNRPKDLLKALKSIQKQTHLPEELIIVDSSCERVIDKTDEFFELFSFFCEVKIRFLYINSKPGLTFQRNVGISFCQAQIIHFMDDDSILQSDYIQKMNRAFKDNPEFIGGMGTIVNIKKKQLNILRRIFLLQRIYSSGYFTLSGMPTHAYGTTKFKKVEVLGGCCMSFRYKIFKKHQFDEALQAYCYMEDCDFSYRVLSEGPLFFNPHAKQIHLQSKVARDKLVKNRAMFIYNYSYLFFKNIFSKNRFKLPFYIWSIIGLFIEALVLRNGQFIKGYTKGLLCFIKGCKRTT